MAKNGKYSRGKSDSKTNRKAFEKVKADKQHTNKVHEACAPIVGKTAGQRGLVKVIKRATVTMITGPAGSGKTYVSAGLAADDLMQGVIDKVICTRPIVSCGGDLGILPGSVDEKIAPYMVPLVDIFNKRIGKSAVECLVKNKQIQQVPLQLLRGASIDNAVILLDECQNATADQLIMLITRIGENTKLIINGDLRQRDIPNSGLQHVINKLGHIDGIEHVQLGVDDVVRSGLVKDVVIALWED